VQELKELQRQGISIQGISKLTGWDRKTIRKYVQAAGVVPEYGPRPAQPSKLDAFKLYVHSHGALTPFVHSSCTVGVKM
jgi:transposase